MSPTNPYILRALHEWLIDNDDIPHIVVNANYPEVVVPNQHIKAGIITLNIADGATKNLQIGNDVITFTARFAGISHQISIPIAAVLSIFGSISDEGVGLPEIATVAEPKVSTTKFKLV